MNVTIEPIEDHSRYKVNDHIIVQVSDFTWLVPNPFATLSGKEIKAFKIYKELIIDNPRFKKHPRSIFKG